MNHQCLIMPHAQTLTFTACLREARRYEFSCAGGVRCITPSGISWWPLTLLD